MNKKELKFNEKSQNKTSSKNRLTLTSHFSTLTSNSRGITLIALVITIIVMLILVGVTVTVAINGGLFNTAKDATRKTQLEADRESLLSAVIGAINDNAEVNFEGLHENLPEGFEKNEEDGEYTSKSGNTFYVDKNGNITTIVERKATTDDYGKYVKYGVDLNGDGILTNDWKVFYEDESGHTFIIAADYVTGDKCEGVKNAIENSHMTKNAESDREYCYYWDSSNVTGTNPQVTYHCNDGHNKELNNQKEQCSYPNLFMADDYYCSDHVGDGKGGNANSRCASTLLCSDNWKPLVKEGEGALYAIGGPTIEMWVASWNEKHGNDVDEDNGITLYANGDDNSELALGYKIGNVAGADKYSFSLKSYSAGYDDVLYFPHHSDGLDNGHGPGYWLSSPSAQDARFVMWIDFIGGIGFVNCDVKYCGLRPVVCLESAVKLASTGEY